MPTLKNVNISGADMITVTENNALRILNSALATLHMVSSGIHVTPTADIPVAFDEFTTNSADTLTPVPAAGEQYVIKNIAITTQDIATTVTVHRRLVSDNYIMLTATLAVGEALVYDSGAGWRKLDAQGRTLTVEQPSAESASIVNRLSAVFAKASVGSMVAGSDGTTWRLGPAPIQAAIPTVAAACHAALAGALQLTARTGTQVRRLREYYFISSNANMAYHLEDRLAHMGGLNGTLTTAQTVDLDLSLLGNNVAQRMGPNGYADVDWWLEWYTATGATVATPTVNVTYDDNTTGNCNIFVAGATALPASVAASRRYRIISATGKPIKKVNSVTLSVTTGTAGNFGVTATRRIASGITLVANKPELRTWGRAEAPIIYDEACLTISFTAGTTSSGNIGGYAFQEVASA